MFILETNGDKARVDTLLALQSWLVAMAVGAEVSIKGLGSLQVIRNWDERDWLCRFIPAGARLISCRDTDLEEIMAMATQMMAGLEELVDSMDQVETLEDDDSAEVWRAQVTRGSGIMWARVRPYLPASGRANRRHEIQAGGVIYRAKNQKPGTTLTIRTVVEIRKP